MTDYHRGKREDLAKFNNYKWLGVVVLGLPLRGTTPMFIIYVVVLLAMTRHQLPGGGSQFEQVLLLCTKFRIL